jgi:quinol monooxygenase YgiN
MPQFAHHVFFTLKDSRPEKVDSLIAACQEHLNEHEGQTYFAVGTRNPEMVREVNDDRFHVSLHLAFADRAAHDRYQVHPRHDAFIAAQKENWAEVRVFDSDLA